MLCIAQDPSVRLRDIGGLVGITERAAHRIVGELVEAGYLERDRVGRRNRYTISTQMPLPDAIAHNQRIGDLLSVLTAQPSPPHTEPSRPPRAAAG